MQRAGKVWGETSAIEVNAFTEMHHASIRRGTCCSKHFHANKWNGFYVVRGELVIRVWQKSGLVDETRLGPGDYTKVPPGIPHRFECLEDAECIELYWPELNPSDIVREDVGGDMLDLVLNEVGKTRVAAE